MESSSHRDHAHSVGGPDEAIKTVKRKITDLDRSKIEEQKKAVRAGYDMDISRPILRPTAGGEKAVAGTCRASNERMFLVTFLGAEHRRHAAPTGQHHVFQASSIAQKHNCQLVRLDFQQEQG